MGQYGWISMRNIPKVKPKKNLNASEFYYKTLVRFFSGKKICTGCKGKGFIIEKNRKTRKTAMIRFGGIDPLETLKDQKVVLMSDVIKEALSFELEGRKVCTKCKGMRFLKIKS